MNNLHGQSTNVRPSNINNDHTSKDTAACMTVFRESPVKSSEDRDISATQALDSLTLSYIEEVLRSEGIEEMDIVQQIRTIKEDEIKT